MKKSHVNVYVTSYGRQSVTKKNNSFFNINVKFIVSSVNKKYTEQI